MNRPEAGDRYDALRVAASVVVLIVALLLLWHTRTLVLTVFLGVLFALAVSAGVDRLQRWKIPRGIAAPLIVFAFLGLVAAFGSWIGPTVREQTIELRTKLPEALEKLEQWVQSRGGGVIATITGFGDDAAPRAPAGAATAADSSVRPGADTGVASGSSDSARGTITRPVVTTPAPTTLRDRLVAQIGE